MHLSVDEKTPPQTHEAPAIEQYQSDSETNIASLSPHFDAKNMLNEVELRVLVSEGVENSYPFGGKYVGSVDKEGQRHGEGRMQWSGEVCYSGRWQQGLPHGHGTMLFEGKSFEGLWTHPEISGFSEVIEAGLDSLEAWLQAYNEGYCKSHIVWLWYNQRHPPDSPFDQSETDLDIKLQAIRLLLAEGEKQSSESGFYRGNGYFGCVKEGVPHGIGRKSYNGTCFYEGEWADGLKHGVGVYYWNPSNYRKSYFKQGKVDGISVSVSQGTKTISEWVDEKEVRRGGVEELS